MEKIDTPVKLLVLIKDKIHNVLRFCFRLAIFIAVEVQHHVRMPRFCSFHAIRNGFFTFNYRLFGLEISGNPADFISDYVQMTKVKEINGEFSKIVNNKLVFPDLMKKYGMPSPKIHAVIFKGALYQLETGEKKTIFNLAESVAHDNRRLVLKPISSSHGKGVLMMETKDGCFSINSETLDPPAFSRLISGLDNYLVTEFILQSEYSARLFPETVNTIRVVTCWDYERGEPFIAQAVQRIGTSRSYPVDNFKAGHGGLAAPVNLQEGVLGKAAEITEKAKVIWHAHHPESGSQIQGIAVHHWDKIKTDVLTFAGKLVFVPYIAWDIVPTANGFCVIEANSNPGTPVLQVHGPLLASERMRRFFRHHNVI